MKRVTITAKPSGSPQRPSADDWVQQKSSLTEPIKRLTIDIPQSLHRLVKSQCVLRGVNMVDVVREFLEREFKPLERDPKPEYRNESAPKKSAPATKKRTP